MTDGWANFSDDGRYRYLLGRHISDTPRRLLFIMLNPSTADANKSDSTITRCINFARDWGYGTIEVVNLFAFRTPYVKALRQAGLIDRMPRMIALQAAGVDPIVCGWERNLTEPPAIKASSSVADGILIDKPARGKQILEALYATDGFALSVADAAILKARARLARRGLFVERTSAVTVAALSQIQQRLKPDETLLLAFSGSGLKDLA